MRIPSRAEVDAFCGGPATLYQRIADILAPALVIASIAFVLIRLPFLPARIPSNYNFAGELTGYSARWTVVLMPAFGLFNDLVLFLVGRFPKSWNTGVRVTVLNRARVYRLVRDLMADLRLACALIFGGFGVFQSFTPERFSGNVSGVLILLVLIPLVRYFVRLPKAR